MTSQEVLAALLDRYKVAKEEYDLARRMVAEYCMAEGVQQMDTPSGIKLSFKSEVKYNPADLTPLKEHFSPDEIEAMMNKPAARSWNKTKLNKLLKQGGEIARIISSAGIETEPQLKITLPKEY